MQEAGEQSCCHTGLEDNFLDYSKMEGQSVCVPHVCMYVQQLRKAKRGCGFENKEGNLERCGGREKKGRTGILIL